MRTPEEIREREKILWPIDMTGMKREPLMDWDQTEFHAEMGGPELYLNHRMRTRRKPYLDEYEEWNSDMTEERKEESNEGTRETGGLGGG